MSSQAGDEGVWREDPEEKEITKKRPWDGNGAM